MPSLRRLLLLAIVCAASLPACPGRDDHGTTERIWRTGTLRLGLAANPAERSYREVVLMQRLAANLGARVEIFPAPIADLTKALAAGMIDALLIRPPEAGRGGSTNPREGADPPDVARLDFTLEGSPVSLLVRRGENCFLGLCRRHLEEATQGPPEAAAVP